MKRNLFVVVLALSLVSLVACNNKMLPAGPSGTVVVSISASPSVVKVGDSATLTWYSRASSCVASGDWSGSKGPSGSEVVGPFAVDGTKTYTLTCDGGVGTAVLVVGQGGPGGDANTVTSPDGSVTVTIVQLIPAAGPLVPGQPQMMKVHVVNRGDDQIEIENDVFNSIHDFPARSENDSNWGSSFGSLSGSFPIIHLKGTYSKTYPQVSWTMEFPGWP